MDVQKNIAFILVMMTVFQPALFAQGNRHFVKLQKENLRNSPNGLRIGELNAGTPVQILETQDKWAKIQFVAWIWRNSLTQDSTLVEGFKIRISHILVESQEKAEEVLSRLKRGEPFSGLADQLSMDRTSGQRGGDLGYFGRGDLLPEFEDAAFKLAKGGVSGIIKTKLGYHIIQRTE